MTTRIVLPTDQAAATYRTDISGWVSADGKFYGDSPGSEDMARWEGCTHVLCDDCGYPTPKPYRVCGPCRERRAQARYDARPRTEWDGASPLFSDVTGDYFLDVDQIAENLREYGGSVESLRLLICEKSTLRQIDEDIWADDLPEDAEIPTHILDALEQLNEIIRTNSPDDMWEPTEYAATGVVVDVEDDE